MVSIGRDAGPIARRTIAFVLAGGRGTRLGPLTTHRAKPALPFAGKLRIIDFTLSNCVNSGIRRVGVCTQYRARSLIRHLHRGWSFLEGRFGEFVESLPPQRGDNDVESYRGTADAVLQNLDLVRQFEASHVLVLAGDHIYKMDYGRMLEEHVESNALVTVACTEVPLAEASAFGVVRVDEGRRIVEFLEKPSAPPSLPGLPDRALASMGIYAFDARFLAEVLAHDAADPSSSHDFGKDILPRLVREEAAVLAHNFAASCVNREGTAPYWRDAGTVDAYWEANLDLTRVVPELDLYDRDWPIWTYQEQAPPAKLVFDDSQRRGTALDSVLSGGCIVSGSLVRRSLLSLNVHVHSYCHIEDSVVLPDVDVGRHSVIRGAVIDNDCRLPEGFTVGVDAAEDRRRFHVTPKGIVLVTPEMLGSRVE